MARKKLSKRALYRLALLYAIDSAESSADGGCTTQEDEDEARRLVGEFKRLLREDYGRPHMVPDIKSAHLLRVVSAPPSEFDPSSLKMVPSDEP